MNIIGLLKYWREEPPAHVILALRYLGPSKSTDSAGAPSRRKASPADEELQAGMLHQIGQSFDGIRKAPVSEKTRSLYEYAQGVINKTHQSGISAA